jgi:(2Fe-2S) ferredoxin
MFNEKKYRVYVCGNIHCRMNGSEGLLRLLEDKIWELGLDGDVEVRVSGCQNRCDFGPNITVWPGPFRYSHLTFEKVEQIVEQHLRDGEPVRALLHSEPRDF